MGPRHDARSRRSANDESTQHVSDLGAMGNGSPAAPGSNCRTFVCCGISAVCLGSRLLPEAEQGPRRTDPVPIVFLAAAAVFRGQNASTGGVNLVDIPWQGASTSSRHGSRRSEHEQQQLQQQRRARAAGRSNDRRPRSHFSSTSANSNSRHYCSYLVPGGDGDERACARPWRCPCRATASHKGSAKCAQQRERARQQQTTW